jgi:hypothetical protein
MVAEINFYEYISTKFKRGASFSNMPYYLYQDNHIHLKRFDYF